MRLCIFGASGRTGSALVGQALGRGHTVTVFYRSDSRASPHPDVKSVWGDLFCRSDIDRAVQDADSVICLFGQRPPSAHALYASATAGLLEVMKAKGVRRLVYVTYTAIGSDRLRRSWGIRALNWFFAKRFPGVAQDRVAQEESVEKSELEWTIIKTPHLTAGPRTGSYRIGTDLKIKALARISRTALIMAILDQLDSDEFVRKRVVVEAPKRKEVTEIDL